MRFLMFGMMLALSLGAMKALASSGSFCNERNELVEYICNEMPRGAGWVSQPDGCFQRRTGNRCGGEAVRPPRPDYPPRNEYPPRYPGRPGGEYGRGLVCKATDDGWEEHSAHNSCGECLSLHGRCTETCSEVNYRCEFEGRDYRGNVVRFSAEARDSYRAESDAYRNCASSANNCRSLGCQTNERAVSRRQCR